ncbi:Kinase D-interacting substrate of 220 kDa [Symbiodinium microadriaticum]|uniref:Kinase D-interacting substrate of 220 kDa n=1 Tax=Symbiodinium microadriaticum TaxID=2951 RepID=A0A1Q9EUL6_SYMMI|nr:Kinase D-interacting substrate of 220 kDa [Symbiodinium microadriaticum]
MEDQLQGISNSSALRAVRVIRVTRMLKTLRLLRIFRFIVALRTLVTSIISTLKNLFWALMLLGIIIYAFAILFCQAVRTHLTDPAMPPLPEEVRDQAERFFGTLLDTMLSLFMSITNGVSWNLILIPLKEVHVVWVVFFLFFIAFTYLAVLNVVTGVFCQSAIESAQTDHALAVQSILANKEAERMLDPWLLWEKCGGLMVDPWVHRATGEVHSPEVREYFETLGLDVWDAWSFFKMLDLDEGGCVEIDEFFMGCLRLRGAARAMDVCKIIHDQTWLLKTQSLFHSHMEEELKQLQQQILALSSKVSSINEMPSTVPRESMAKPGTFDTSAGSVVDDVASLDSLRDLQVLLLPFAETSQRHRKMLMDAACNGWATAEVEALLQLPMDPDARGTDDRSPLMWASLFGYVDVALLLLEAGAQADWCDHDGDTALMYAATNGHAQVVKILLEAGAQKDLRSKDGWTALMHAAWNGDPQVAQLLLEAGANKDLCDSRGHTPLMLATEAGHNEVRQLMLAGGPSTYDPLMMSPHDSDVSD